MDRRLERRWLLFVNQVQESVDTRVWPQLMDAMQSENLGGGITNRCSAFELFFTFVLFMSVVQLSYMFRQLFRNASIHSLEQQVADKIVHDIAKIFHTKQEKAIRRQTKFTVKTLHDSKIDSGIFRNKYLEELSLQAYMFVFVQVKPLRDMLQVQCSMLQYLTKKAVSEKQVDELIEVVGSSLAKNVKIQSLWPQSTQDLIKQAEHLTDTRLTLQIGRKLLSS